jgi:hypothetical protein
MFRSTSVTVISHVGDKKISLDGKSSGRYIFVTVWEICVLGVKIYCELDWSSRALTTAERFVCESPSIVFCLHIHIVRPESLGSKSEEDSIAAYVTVPISEDVRETAGHENVMDGPRVCDTTGCNVETWDAHQKRQRIIPLFGPTSKICTPSRWAVIVANPSEFFVPFPYVE